ncbi:hypothetical protein ACFU5O_26065 [Streptomyces sp. NPDC057445]|uniref:hypothetical protein n=1 Tax=Streptomyces sp. NPDC057445 TaxID=3346136 RepID=UPI00368A7EAA
MAWLDRPSAVVLGTVACYIRTGSIALLAASRTGDEWALVERHKDKTFSLDLPGGARVSADGRSAEEVERLLKASEEMLRRQLAAQRLTTEAPELPEDPQHELVEQAARGLLEQRADIAGAGEWERHFPVGAYLDGMAELVGNCRTARDRTTLAAFLAQVVNNLRFLERIGSSPAAATEVARQALDRAAEALADRPRGQ